MRTIQRDIVGGFIFSGDDKLLLGKIRQGGVYPGCWIVPGGGVDEGETKHQALQREIMEETGINIKDAIIEQFKEVLTGESEKNLRDTGELVLAKMYFYNFIIKLPQTSNEIAIKTEDDFKNAQWFDKSELPKLKLSPPTVISLKKMGILS